MSIGREGAIPIFKFDVTDVLILGRGTCAHEALRSSGGSRGVTLLGIAGIPWTWPRPRVGAVDPDRLRNEAHSLQPFAGRRVFLAGDISPAATDKPLVINLDDLDHVLNSVPIARIARRSLEQVCSDAGLVPTSLHDAVDGAGRGPGAPPPPWLPSSCGETRRGDDPFFALLDAICSRRSDSRLAAGVERRGRDVVARLYGARQEKFDTSFIDGDIVRSCAAAGFTQILLSPEILVFDRRSVSALCRYHRIILARG